MFSLSYFLYMHRIIVSLIVTFNHEIHSFRNYSKFNLSKETVFNFIVV